MDEKDDRSTCQLLRNKWRQFASILPGLMLLVSIGMHNVFVIYELDQFELWPKLLYASRSLFATNLEPSSCDSYDRFFSKEELSKNQRSLIVILMWFVGAIIGSLFGAIFVRYCKKRTIYVSFFHSRISFLLKLETNTILILQNTAAWLQIVAGILFYYMRDASFHVDIPLTTICYKKFALFPFGLGVMARLISGFVFGVAHLAVTVHASELSSRRLRRIISSAIVTIMAVSTLFYAVVMRNWYSAAGHAYFQFGFDLIGLGVVTLVLVPIFTTETILHYLVRGNVTTARAKFTKLHQERIPSAGTMRKFVDFQEIVRDEVESVWSFRSFCIVLAARLLNLFLWNAPVIIYAMGILQFMPTIPFLSYDGRYLIELIGARFIIGLIILIIVKYLERQKILYYSLIPLTSLIMLDFIATNLRMVPILLRMMMMYSVPTTFLFLSFGLDYYQQQQSIETFTTTNKAWSIAIIAIFEHLFHSGIIATVLYVYLLQNMITLVAVGIIVSSSVLLALVPSTQKLSLRAETKNNYRDSYRAIY